MTWLIIVLAVGLALAPLLHFAPTKAQRKAARLGETAALGGLFVEFRDPPEKDRAPPGPAPIYYGKRLPPPRSGARRRGAWVRDPEEGWRGAPRRTPVPGALQQLPEAVTAASLDEGSCGVYWHELGDEDTVAEIGRVLGQWAEVVDVKDA